MGIWIDSILVFQKIEFISSTDSGELNIAFNLFKFHFKANNRYSKCQKCKKGFKIKVMKIEKEDKRVSWPIYAWVQYS